MAFHACGIDTPGGAITRRGCTVLLTGLSGAGKSTLARALAARLSEAGRPVTLLDGDELRRLLSPDLGYSREDRLLNCRRAGFIAGEVARHGGITVCALIAPYEQARAEIRELASAHGGFLLVHVATPVDVCAARDRKGVYARARAGTITNLTGIGEAYEVPLDPDMVLDMTAATTEEAADAMIGRLTGLGVLG
jgi:sulfate adenylyltransferase